MQQREEKQQIQSYLNQIDDQNKQIDQANNAALKAQRKLKPLQKTEAVTADKLRNYILRLKTTSVHSSKYAETLSVLLELIRREREAADRNNKPEDLEKPNSILSQIRQTQNYPFVAKGVSSRDDAVVSSSLDLIHLIDDMDQFKKILSDDAFITSLVKVYRTKNDINQRRIKLMTLMLIAKLLKIDKKRLITNKAFRITDDDREDLALKLYNLGIVASNVNDLHALINMPQDSKDQQAITLMQQLFETVYYLALEGIGMTQFLGRMFLSDIESLTANVDLDVR